MNWKTRYRPPIPKIGDERTRCIFALIPRDCTDGITRWLEPVIIREKFLELRSIVDTVVGGWTEISAHPADKEPEKTPEPYVYTYEFRNSKENPVEPTPDYEGAAVYRYDEDTHQYFPIGSIKNGGLSDTIPARLGEWSQTDYITGAYDCGNENGSYAFDSVRDKLVVGERVYLEVGRPKFNLTPEELTKYGTSVTKWGWIEACETAADITKTKDDINFHEYTNFDFETRSDISISEFIREDCDAINAHDKFAAGSGCGGSQVSETLRQTVAGGSKKNARKKTGGRAIRAKKD